MIRQDRFPRSGRCISYVRPGPQSGYDFTGDYCDLNNNVAQNGKFQIDVDDVATSRSSSASGVKCGITGKRGASKGRAVVVPTPKILAETPPSYVCADFQARVYWAIDNAVPRAASRVDHPLRSHHSVSPTSKDSKNNLSRSRVNLNAAVVETPSVDYRSDVGNTSRGSGDGQSRCSSRSSGVDLDDSRFSSSGNSSRSGSRCGVVVPNSSPVISCPRGGGSYRENYSSGRYRHKFVGHRTCELCDVSFSSYMDLEQHLLSTTHKRQSQKHRRGERILRDDDDHAVGWLWLWAMHVVNFARSSSLSLSHIILA